MPAPSAFLGWIPSGNASYITDPPAGQKATGWLANEAPPFQYMNWLFYITDQWLQYLAPSMTVGAAAIPAVPTVLVTTGALGVGTQTLEVASATGLTTGMGISGTYILPGTYIQAISGTTITMSTKATSTVVSEAITFSQAIASGVTIGAQLREIDAKLRMVNPVGTIIATFPGLTGAYNCVATTVADSAGLVLCGGQTLSDATAPMNGAVIPNINDSCFIMGLAAGGNGTGAAAATHTHSTTSQNVSAVDVPSHQHDLSAAGWANVGLYSTVLQAKTSGAPGASFSATNSPSYTSAGNASHTVDAVGLGGLTGFTITQNTQVNIAHTHGTGNNSADVRPKYISAVYCMFVK